MKNISKTVETAREYLSADNPAEAASLLNKLNRFDGDLDAVIEELKPHPGENPETGLLKQIPFQHAEFAAKYPWSRMSCYVPKNYDSSNKYGLLIYLHGGGRGNGNSSPENYVDESAGLSDIFMDSGRIVCLPSAPPNMKSYARWHLPEVDDYIASVIDELSLNYNIDPNNILLAGHSMGGMGANHMAQRFSDRFASIFSAASCWDIAYWPCLAGTTYWAAQGRNDAIMFMRRHGSDIEFMRLAELRLNQAGIANRCIEHQGRHDSGHARKIFKEWLCWCDRENIRRDPCYPHVVAVTPRGLTPWTDFRRHKTPMAACQNYIDFHEIPDSPDCRWVTIDEVGEETIIYDMAVMSDCKDEVEQEWNDFSLALKRKHLNGGVVETFIENDNVIEATPVNVKKFTLWLNSEMVDLNNFRVIVQGKEMFNGSAKPKLGTMLESYKRRRDWGMLYPVKITFEDTDDSWKVKDQVKVKNQI